MGLTDLPAEIFRGILEMLVKTHHFYGVLELRLVNKMFEYEVSEAILRHSEVQDGLNLMSRDLGVSILRRKFQEHERWSHFETIEYGLFVADAIRGLDPELPDRDEVLRTLSPAFYVDYKSLSYAVLAKETPRLHQWFYENFYCRPGWRPGVPSLERPLRGRRDIKYMLALFYVLSNKGQDLSGLLDEGFDIKDTDNPYIYTGNLVTLALRLGSQDIAMRLVKSSSLMEDRRREFSYKFSTEFSQVLCDAALMGHEEIFEFLMDGFIHDDGHKNLGHLPEYWGCPLRAVGISAAQGGHLNIISRILTICPEMGTFMLGPASISGREDIVRYIVQNSENLHFDMDYLRSMSVGLGAAAWSGNISLVKYLLEVEPEEVKHSSIISGILCSLPSGYLEITELLLSCLGGSLRGKSVQKLMSLVARRAHPKALNMLISHGIQITEGSARTLLQNAASRRDLETIKTLQEHGLLTDKVKLPVLERIHQRQQTPLIKLLAGVGIVHPNPPKPKSGPPKFLFPEKVWLLEIEAQENPGSLYRFKPGQHIGA
ncbi:hypothetical protein ABW19_dt0202424 [Dactylella cylindrospora]|nr:hypothetical protein ABW19_dt0202424 [Dactylella cylindrospora]